MSPIDTKPDRDDVAALARQAGLDLPEPYFSELVESYGHVNAMLQRLRGSATAAGEQAHVFRPEAPAPRSGQ